MWVTSCHTSITRLPAKIKSRFNKSGKKMPAEERKRNYELLARRGSGLAQICAQNLGQRTQLRPLQWVSSGVKKPNRRMC